MDVVGLYPHIPHEEGLEALKKALDKSDAELPVDDLVSLAKVVLENNFFEFDEKLFRQKLGTAIGTKLGTDHLIFHGGGGAKPKKNIEHVSNGRKKNRTSLTPAKKNIEHKKFLN